LLTVSLGPLLGVAPDPPPVTPVLGAGACSVVVSGGAVIAGALVVDDDVGASLLLG
jgi:hypothetical protein